LEPNRRKFLQTFLSVPVTYAASRASISSPRHLPALSDEFLFGASVYPELQTREEWRRMLTHFQNAHMNTVRVSESSWGNLETVPGRYDFGWLRDFLDILEERRMKAILGTSSYVPPQWLVGEHPEILVQPLPGYPGDPMSRKSPCLNHSLYREACRRYISAIGQEFKDHPAVIGWQLDNEIEFLMGVICYNPACEKAWHEWLKKTYQMPQEFNSSLDLVSWGMKIDSFDEVPQPRMAVEGLGAYVEFVGDTNARRDLPALGLANFHFRRDVVLGFLAEQAQTLRGAGVSQWITTDWNTVWTAVADDPKAGEIMDIAGLNYYQPKEDNLDFWKTLTWHQDMHRSAYGRKYFLTTENRFGTTGATFIWDPFPTKAQFRMWGLQATAFGTSGLLYWSGNRWRGGHWPQWGGLLDWSGRPEPDFSWAAELGEFFSNWGGHLLEHPVKASAVVLTDFDQRATLAVYPHIKSSLSVLPQSFDAFHRLGIGVDSMNLSAAENSGNLEKYSLVLIPAATALDNAKISEALAEYVRKGGVVVITPFTAYTDWNGIFRGDGFGANLKELTGTLVRTIRWVGVSTTSGKQDPEVEWQGGGMQGVSSVGLEGYCEFMEVSPQAEIIANFRSVQAILNGKPAVVRAKHDRGTVVKLGFWPQDDSLLRLIARWIPENDGFLTAPAPEGVAAVPRDDASLFIVNTTSKVKQIGLRKPGHDRLSDASFHGVMNLEPYQVLWLS
jgi:beta-galactosidase